MREPIELARRRKDKERQGAIKLNLDVSERMELEHLRKDKERRDAITRKRNATREENLKREKERMEHERQLYMSKAERDWYERELRHYKYTLNRKANESETDDESVVDSESETDETETSSVVDSDSGSE